MSSSSHGGNPTTPILSRTDTFNSARPQLLERRASFACARLMEPQAEFEHRPLRASDVANLVGQ